MKRLKFKEKFKYKTVNWTYYVRSYVITDFPDRIFVEVTSHYVYNDKPRFHRSWYCPTVSEYIQFIKTKKKSHMVGLGGTASLKYWFERYVK